MKMDLAPSMMIAAAAEWRTLSVGHMNNGFAIGQTEDRFRAESWAETALKAVAAISLTASYALWFVPLSALPVDPVLSKAMASASMIAIGLGIYAYATRGFRRVVYFDLKQREVHLRTLNSQGQSRIVRQIHCDRIESIFVKRAEAAELPAGLFLRLKGNSIPVCALHGDAQEIGQLHDFLCRSLREDKVGHRRLAPPATPVVVPKRAKPAVSHLH